MKRTREEHIEHLRRLRASVPEHEGMISFGTHKDIEHDDPSARARRIGDGSTVRGEVVAADDTGVTVRVRCPFCLCDHEHVLTEAGRVAAVCGAGWYAVTAGE